MLIVERWIARQRGAARGEAGDALVADEIDDLVRSDVALGWAIISALVAGVSDSRSLCNIGAGPLETFILCHRSAAIQLLGEQAPKERKLRNALSCVWRDDLNDELWGTILRLREPILAEDA